MSLKYALHVDLEFVLHTKIIINLEFRWLCDSVIVVLHMVLNLTLIAYGLEMHFRDSLRYICSRIR